MDSPNFYLMIVSKLDRFLFSMSLNNLALVSLRIVRRGTTVAFTVSTAYAISLPSFFTGPSTRPNLSLLDGNDPLSL